MYEKKQPDSVNHARVEVFLQKYKPNTRIAMASCVKKMGSSSFTPSSRVIKVRIKRKRYFCGIWNNAATANPTIFQHKYCGWFWKMKVPNQLVIMKTALTNSFMMMMMMMMMIFSVTMVCRNQKPIVKITINNPIQ